MLYIHRWYKMYFKTVYHYYLNFLKQASEQLVQYFVRQTFHHWQTISRSVSCRRRCRSRQWWSLAHSQREGLRWHLWHCYNRRKLHELSVSGETNESHLKFLVKIMSFLKHFCWDFNYLRNYHNCSNCTPLACWSIKLFLIVWEIDSCQYGLSFLLSPA